MSAEGTMISVWGQIRLLTWKNYVLQKRRPIGTAFEILVPLLLMFVMLSLRSVIVEDDFSDTSFCDQYVSIADGGNGTSFCNARQWIGPNFMGETDADDSFTQYYDTISFAPNSSAAVVELMEIVRDELAPLFARNGKNVTFITLPDNADYEAIVREESPLLFAAVVFTNPDQLSAASGQTPSYQLRLPSDLPTDNGQPGMTRWQTKNNFPTFDSGGIRVYDQIPYFSPLTLTYYSAQFSESSGVGNGFSLIQTAIDRGIATLLHPTRAKPQAAPRLKSYPFPAHQDDNYIFVIRGFFPLILVLSFLYTAMSITRSLINEKETRMREAMRMMGLSSWVNWLAWFIKDFLMLEFVVILIVIIFSAGDLVANSSNFTVFIFLSLFMLALVSYSFMMSTFFSASNVGGIVSLLFFFLLYQPYQATGDNGVYDQLNEQQKGAMCLAFSSCMGIGARILSQFELRGVGLQLSNLNEDPADGDHFTMADVMGFLFLDAVVMWLIAWYVDKVFPGQYGIALPYFFFLDRGFWTNAALTPASEDMVVTHNIHDDGESGASRKIEHRMSLRFKDDFEPLSEGHEIGIAVHGLTKEWPTPGGIKTAVDHVNLEIPVGMLTVVIGTNGAGKTTALNMITGLVDATSGSIMVHGHNMRTDTKNARKTIGYCPQFDILWDALTVEEHLYFFMRLRGCNNRKVIAEDTDQLLADIDLGAKKKSRAGTLSGGQKRALSVSLALAGGTKTVVLDEPTSGMDAQKRRRTWDMMLKRKPGRTIILTTHHMDEADVLGDRIVIMKSGQIRCAGSPLFLKNRFECGYYLVAVKEPGCDSRKVTEVVKRYVPNSVLINEDGAELSYSLPKQSAKSFGKLFAELEEREKELKIDSCGASMTTMEQVFLRIAHGELGADSVQKTGRIRSRDTSREANDETAFGFDNTAKEETNASTGPGENNTNTSTRDSNGAGTDTNGEDDDNHNGEADDDHNGDLSKAPEETTLRTGHNLLYDQCAAMLYKRRRHFMQHKKTIVSQIVVPTFFMLLALTISTQVTETVDSTEPCRQFDTTSYSSDTIFISDKNTGFDTQPASMDYYATAGVMGSLVPTATQFALAQTAKDLALSSPLYSSSNVLNISGVNMTTFLLDRANNYKKTEFYRKASLSTSVTPGAIWLNDACEVRVGTTYTALTEVKIAAGGTYVLQRVAADFGNVGASATYSLQCPTACNSTGGTDRAFCDYNKTGNTLIGMPWGVQCGNNPTVQWIEITPAVAEVGLSYTVTCASGATLSVAVVTATDPDLFNTTAAVALAWYNRQAYHTSSEALNFVGNAIARQHLGDNAVQITTSNCPLPKSNDELARDEQADDLALNLGINVGLAISFLVGSFALFPINERNQHAKHIQLVSGLDVRTYWLTAFVWDYCTSIIPFVLFLIIFAAFDIQELAGERLGIVFLLLLLVGWAAIPAVYCMTFVFKTSAGGYTLTVVIFFFATLAMTIVTFILPLLEDGLYRENGVAEDCKRAFLINPVFACTQGIVDVYYNYKFLDFCKAPGRASFCIQYGFNPQDDYFSMEGLGIGPNVLALALEGFFFIFLLLFIEKMDTKGVGHDQKKNTVGEVVAEDQDTDVWDERVRVRDGGADGEVVVARELTKSWSDSGKLAVDRVTFGVPKGQCFGLLGTNGAGKTTVFRMITGETSMTSGGATVGGADVATNLVAARQHMGYAPQYDGLIPHLTGRDHLVMFARLRGMPVEHIAREVNRMIKQLDLEEHADNLAGTYSGGNKRKLSTAISLVGRPKVILLDEPTTGIDPSARRMLWNTILRVVKEGTTVILTTHSMEEVEALCSRLTIMVSGKMKCIGSLQHLKGRFGTGFYLTFKMTNGTTLSQFIGAVRNEAAVSRTEGLELEVLAQFDQSVSVWVRKGASLGQLFTWMESPVIKALVVDYAINQPSLEQVFLGFAKQSEAEQAAEREKAEHNASSKKIHRPSWWTGAMR